jgi:peptidoglycan/LPS O-acetylase OafA/YrhL
MQEPSTNIYLPGLNGLRAIAALSVVISHITISFPDFGLIKIGGWGFAAHGVTIFFTISGFLITYLLLLEKVKQKISIKNFYTRRILRIWPLYYLYLIISVGCLIANSKFSPNSILYYVFFCANLPYIFGGSQVLIAHLWSIGVEEQFYLIWPVFVKFSQKRMILLTSIIVLILIGMKFIARYVLHNELLKIFLDVNRFECMLIGAAGAMLFFNQNKLFITIVTHGFIQKVSWIILVIIALGKVHTPGPTEHILMSIITLVLIIGQINTSGLKINLDNKMFDFLGKISYGLYVYHPLIIYLFSKIIIGLNINIYPKVVIIFSTIIFSTILVSHISYNYYEKPFLKLKSRFTTVKSQNSKYL